MHVPFLLPRPVAVREWTPQFPPGTLRSLILHWTAGDYQSVYPAYHFCLTGSAEVVVHATHDLRANMRDVRSGTDDYAAHTLGRNSFAAGVAVCAMLDATPDNFGAYPLTAAQIEALCVVSARIAAAYDIATVDVRTHAEAALDDAYFGAGTAQSRWDIARLEPATGMLVPHEARSVAARLRKRITELR